MPIAVRAIAKWLHRRQYAARTAPRNLKKSWLDALKASLQLEPSRPVAPQVMSIA